MSILDASIGANGQSDVTANASALLAAMDTEACFAYGVNSNTGVAVFGAPWTDLGLNAGAFGKFGWQKKAGAGNVGVNYAVPGTQAWAVLLATFGSNALPVVVGRGNNSNVVPFTSGGMPFTAGESLIAVFEFISNAANFIPISVTDSAGNVWVKVADSVGTRLGPGGQLAQVSMFYCQNAIGGAGVTISVAGNSGVVNAAWSVFGISGLVNVSKGQGGLLSLGVGL